MHVNSVVMKNHQFSVLLKQGIIRNFINQPKYQAQILTSLNIKYTTVH